jgi:RNA polymerase sigma-70 factor (ECF subfamily)
VSAGQQVFLVGSRRIDEIEKGGERSHSLGIALRVASRARRASQRRRSLLDVLVVESSRVTLPPPSPEEMLDHKRLLVLLAPTPDEMPHKLREAFVSFELEELSGSKVAPALRVPVGTVASPVGRARDRLRRNPQKNGAP